MHDIRGMEDWRHTILDGLKQSHLFLLVLSPAYLASEYCEWDIVEYLKYESARAVLGEGVAPTVLAVNAGRTRRAIAPSGPASSGRRCGRS